MANKDDINPIGFLIHTPEIINHYSSVWDELEGNPFDIVLHNLSLKKRKTSAKWNYNVRDSMDLLKAGAKYEVLVSNHAMHQVQINIGKNSKQVRRLIELIGKRNIRFMYAAGKGNHNFSQWNKSYDGVLVYGPYHAEAFKKKFDLPCQQVGYPRFDRFFKNNNPDLAVLRKKYNCDPSKRIIVWLPTWKELSSLGYFDFDISSLRHQYNIVVKVHPLTPKDEQWRVSALMGRGFSSIITAPVDNVELFQLADFIFCDYGGSPFGAVYTGKRFLLLNVPGAEEDQLTGNQSPDVLMRKEFRSVDHGCGQISELLDDEIYWKRHFLASEQWKKRFFAPNFGSSSYEAAKSILNTEWLER